MIVASVSERNFPVGVVDFGVTRAQLLGAGVMSHHTRLLVRATRVGWPTGIVGSAEVQTSAGWGARYDGIAGGTPERGGSDAVFELSIRDGAGALVPVLDMAPITVRIELTQPLRSAISVEAL